MVSTNMKIQIAEKSRIKGIPVLWPIECENTDIIANPCAPEKFPFGREKVSCIYDFGALGNCASDQLIPTIMQWLRALKKGGSILITEVDFELMARQFAGADISIDEFNANFNRRTHLVKENLAEKLREIGVPHGNIKQWNGGHQDFFVYSHEFVMEVIKP